MLRDVRAAAPAEARERAALLLDWAGQGTSADIPDPYTGGAEDFRRVWAMVDAAAAGIVARIARAASGRIPG